MVPIVTPAEMGELDAADCRPLDELIELAGWHVARHARTMMGGVYGRRVVALAGPGNNGADALVAARLLSRWGARVEVLAPDSDRTLRGDLVIDGAFGTGMNRPYEPPAIDPASPLLAVDIPSGVHGLTGELLGSPLAATSTITFEAYKPGLLLHPGAQCCGDIEVVDLRLGSGATTNGIESWLFGEVDARESLPQPKPTDHKWNRAVWVVGGSAGMHGAPSLAANAALKSGAGLAWCSVPGDTPVSIATEVVFKPLDAARWHQSVLAESDRFGALVVGPGIGRSDDTKAAVQALLATTSKPVVVDGDALRLLGGDSLLRPDIVLTPHDGEFEALSGHRPGPDRFADVRALASRLGATVLLKGPLTIVANPTGRCIAVNHGDVRLATAGSGDVLAGMIGSYLAAGVEPTLAAALAAWLHAEAGQTQARIGMVASDLLASLPDVSTRLAESHRTGDQ